MQIDPSKDRGEFLGRLDALFCPLSRYKDSEILKAMVFNDKAFLDAIRAKKTVCDSEKQKYIELYDAAPTEKDKASVVGSVTLKNIV